MLSEIDRQLAHVWRRRLLKKDKGAPRIAVVGNCQSFGIAYGMKLLLPAAQVDRFTIVRKGVADLKFLAKTLSAYDHVFSLEFQPGFLRGGGWQEFIALMPSVAPIPSVVFSGFHPDTVYILDPARGGRPIEGPTGPYHSAIALFAYLRGKSVEETEALFTADLFEALGYCDAWEESTRQFLDLAAAAKLDLAPELVRWTRQGRLMYSMNRPTACVGSSAATAASGSRSSGSLRRLSAAISRMRWSSAFASNAAGSAGVVLKYSIGVTSSARVASSRTPAFTEGRTTTSGAAEHDLEPKMNVPQAAAAASVTQRRADSLELRPSRRALRSSNMGDSRIGGSDAREDTKEERAPTRAAGTIRLP